ncbi:efflux RND transporter periplasmic adaptor subunit [Paraburkholderia bannensis]|uniref:efflux RND transporter periplasmic adaptor subunit n=1 Tax=Paraburkholderia bannensis TaxID=765414 RepID=UPI002AB62F22|nr:efflux RND transporter periplasmic adaptor subunit [Paraburkholderia bannensis]
MNPKLLVRAVAALAAGATLLGTGYVAGSRHASPATSSTSASVEHSDTGAARKVLYWHDPMVPNQHFDKPGKSPFMDMQLQPVYADATGSDGIKIDPTLQQNLGVRYATVQRVNAPDGFDAIGTTQFDESSADVVQSRVTGYIDHLAANAPMQHIAKGAPVASLYVPDWLAPQEEYLALRRSGMDGSLLAAARARMKALSIPDALVAALDRTGQVQTHLTLTAAETGVLSELNVREGAMVTPGQTIAKITGLTKLWLIVEIPESLALQARPGMSVDATAAADGSQHFSGRIREILPGISADSRTLQARLEIDNAQGKLTPGMLMRVRVSSASPSTQLVVPSEAVITTGKRSLVIVRGDDGQMRPVEVAIGRDAGSNTVIASGLTEGQQVVASGQFLIDSEASLKSVLPRLGASSADAASNAASSATSSTAPGYETTGKIEKITPETITLSHQPVPALHWSAMTMAFAKPSADAFADVRPGETVRFAFRQTDSGYQLTKVEPLGDQP